MSDLKALESVGKTWSYRLGGALSRKEEMLEDESLAEALLKALECKGLLLKDYYKHSLYRDESKEIKMSLKGLKPIVLKECYFRDLKVGVLISEPSGEVVAIFATKIEGDILYILPWYRARVTYVAGLKPMKVEVVTIQKETYYEKVGEGCQPKEEEKKMEEAVDLPLPPIKAIKIFRELVESRKKDAETELKEKETELKEKKISKGKKERLKQESLQLINIINMCNGLLRKLEELEAEMKAEKARELEGLNGMSVHIQMFCPKKLAPEAEKHKLIESASALLIQTLKGRFEDLEEWLSPQNCEGTVQLSERAESRTTCIGSVLDLHVHFVYEAVESDKGLAVTVTMRAIRVPEASKQQ